MNYLNNPEWVERYGCIPYSFYQLVIELEFPSTMGNLNLIEVMFDKGNRFRNEYLKYQKLIPILNKYMKNDLFDLGKVKEVIRDIKNEFFKLNFIQKKLTDNFCIVVEIDDRKQITKYHYALSKIGKDNENKIILHTYYNNYRIKKIDEIILFSGERIRL